MAMLRPLLHFLFLIDANFVSAASRNLWELMSLPSSHKSSASSSPPENFGQGRRLIVEETLRQHQHRRKLLSCYKTELRELPPRQQPGARKCCCDDGSCASDPECSMDPLVPAKFHAPVIELNVHPSDEGIKAEGASAVATIDANVNTVRGEEPRSPESAAAAAAAAAAATTTTTTTTTAQNGTQNTTAIATNGVSTNAAANAINFNATALAPVSVADASNATESLVSSTELTLLKVKLAACETAAAAAKKVAEAEIKVAIEEAVASTVAEAQKSEAARIKMAEAEMDVVLQAKAKLEEENAKLTEALKQEKAAAAAAAIKAQNTVTDTASALSASQEALAKTQDELKQAREATETAQAEEERLETEATIWRERAEHPDIAAHLALRGREAAVEVYQSNPGLQAAVNRTVDLLLPSLLEKRAAGALYLNQTKRGIIQTLGPHIGEQYTPLVSGLLVYGLIFIPLFLAFWCTSTVVAAVRVRPLLMFSHMYFICGSLVAASIAQLLDADPFELFQAENNGAYLFFQAFMAFLLISYSAMLVIVFFRSRNNGEWIMRGLQLIVVLLFAGVYYQRIWEPAMLDKKPATYPDFLPAPYLATAGVSFLVYLAEHRARTAVKEDPKVTTRADDDTFRITVDSTPIKDQEYKDL